MNLFGRHSYYQAHEIKPGNLYLASRGDDVQLVLGIEPAITGDNTGILILKRISGTAFTSDFIAVTGERFAHQSTYILLQECMIVPSISVSDWRMTSYECAPLGALYTKNGSMFLVAKSSGGEVVLVDGGNGAVKPPNMHKAFWTLKWTVKQKDENGEWKDILS